ANTGEVRNRPTANKTNGRDRPNFLLNMQLNLLKCWTDTPRPNPVAVRQPGFLWRSAINQARGNRQIYPVKVGELLHTSNSDAAGPCSSLLNFLKKINAFR